jgi:flagellar biosynthesis protein FlhB
LQAFVQGDVERALQLSRAHVGELGLTLLWLALLVVACAALVGVVVQGPVFVWPRRARRPFERPRPSYVAAALWCLALCGLLLFSLRDAFWLELASGSGADPRASTPLITLLARWWTNATSIALGVSLVDAGFARAQFFRALWLTRREQRAEMREAYGSPELRAARAQARHASRDGAAT